MTKRKRGSGRFDCRSKCNSSRPHPHRRRFPTRTAAFILAVNATYFLQGVDRCFAFIHPHIASRQNVAPLSIYEYKGTSRRDHDQKRSPKWPRSSVLPAESSDGDVDPPAPLSMYERVALSLFGVPSTSSLDPDSGLLNYFQILTLVRIGVPAIGLGIVAGAAYVPLAVAVASSIQNGAGDASQIAGTFNLILGDNSNQFIQNMHNAMGLLFSIFTVYTYFFMYRQQEQIFYSLFEEVTSAKALLEQIGLISAGRTSLYRDLLECIRQYTEEDLRGVCGTDANVTQSFQRHYGPASMLSCRPENDPLERIMFLTSVGVPSRSVYDTVRALRRARARRLAASQRKVPELQMALLYSLVPTVLVTFPVVGAGAQTVGGLGILELEGVQFGFLLFFISVALGMVREMTNTDIPNAYSANLVCDVIVKGLRDELEARIRNIEQYEESISLPPTSSV